MSEAGDLYEVNFKEVEKVLTYIARKIARTYALEFEDMHQQAREIMLTNPDHLTSLRGDGERTLGTLQSELTKDLHNYAQTLARRQAKNTSYEERFSADDGSLDERGVIAYRDDSNLYDRELVEALLPAVWDEGYCWGIRAENAPDPDMPRGTINKSTGNTFAAHIVDIKTGWARAPLTLEERRVLLLQYGMDWERKDIATNQECSRNAVSWRADAGVGKIVAYLNGDLALMFEIVSP